MRVTIALSSSGHNARDSQAPTWVWKSERHQLSDLAAPVQFLCSGLTGQLTLGRFHLYD